MAICDGCQVEKCGKIWACSESVTNIVGRADLLAGFGVLAGLLCHVKSTAVSGRRKLAWLAALMLAATIACCQLAELRRYARARGRKVRGECDDTEWSGTMAPARNSTV